MRGLWITFEGIGGSGKSTQAKLLYDWLLKQGCAVILTREPGGTKTGEEIRRMVKEVKEQKLESFTELMLFEADRHETVQKIIIPSVNSGKMVISDRGIDGSIAYQGFGRGLDLTLIDHLTAQATGNRKPDITFHIDIDPQVSMRRIANRKDEQDQFDFEKIHFQEKVREGFLFAAKCDPFRVHVLDGSDTVENLHKQIVEIYLNITRELGTAYEA